MNQRPEKRFGINETIETLVKNVSLQDKEVILVIFGNPYSIQYFDNINTIIVAYQDETAAHKAVAKALLGEISCDGHLPVTL